MSTPQKKTLQLNEKIKKRDAKSAIKAKRNSNRNKKHSKQPLGGKKALLQEIKQKIDDSINEVKGLIEPTSLKFNLIFKQQFRAPQLKEDWIDWKLTENNAYKENDLKLLPNSKVLSNPTIDYPMMITQSAIRQVAQQLLKSPPHSLDFGLPTLCFSKEFFCGICQWENLNIFEFDSAKSKDVHYQRKHKQYLCEYCGQFEKNTHNIAIHKKQSQCIQANISNHIQNQSVLLSRVTAFTRQVKQEENSCPTCRRLEKYSNPSSLKIGQHLLTEHGEFRISMAKFFQLDLQRAFDALTDHELSILREKKFISLSMEGTYTQMNSDIVGGSSLLLMTYEGKLRAALNFCIQVDKFSRVAFIFNYWTSSQYYLDLGIALSELRYRVEKIRVGKICLFVQKKHADYFERLNYEKNIDRSCFEQLGTKFCDTNNSELYSIRTQEYISSFIPPCKTPSINQPNDKSDLLRLLILQLKFNDIEMLLCKYLELQINTKGKRQNQKAIKSDQAITPHGIFKEIYERILIYPYQMFDVCRYQKDWDASINFNALKEEWPGEFIFVNPPFSVGSWFVTKIFLEFLKGKNIIVILPEISTESSFGSMLFRMLGSVHQLGIIKFGTHEKKLRSPVSLIFLLQPDHIDYLKSLKKQKKNNQKMSQCSPPNTLACRGLLTQHKKQCISQLINQKLTVREIQKCVKTSYSSISAIRKKNSRLGGGVPLG